MPGLRHVYTRHVSGMPKKYLYNGMNGVRRTLTRVKINLDMVYRTHRIHRIFTETSIIRTTYLSCIEILAKGLYPSALRNRQRVYKLIPSTATCPTFVNVAHIPSRVGKPSSDHYAWWTSVCTTIIHGGVNFISLGADSPKSPIKLTAGV